MFNYPFVSSSKSIYTKLGIGPDSGKDEINKAKDLYIRKINRQIAELKEYNELKEELLKATENKEQLLIKAESLKSQLNKENISTKDRNREIERLEEEITTINAFDPGKKDKRDEYDLYHPPAILLRVNYDVPTVYVDKRSQLAILRKDLSSFFISKNLKVYHPSDFTKTDFSSDYRYNKLLDN